MERIKRYFVRLVILTIVAIVTFGVYYINCVLYQKEFINDLIYIRLINSMKEVSGEYYIYDEVRKSKDENNINHYMIIFDDNTWLEKDSANAMKELKAMKEAAEEFLDKNPHYFPEGSKIEIITNHLYIRNNIINYADGVVYDDFVKLLVFDNYKLEDVANNFRDIRYLYFGYKIDNIDIIGEFTNLETLGVDTIFTDRWKAISINNAYPYLKLEYGYDYE